MSRRSRTSLAPGTQTFAWAWSDGVARGEGGGIFLVWVKDVNTADIFRDADVASDGRRHRGLRDHRLDHDRPRAVAGASVRATAFSTADIIFINDVAVNSEHYDIGEYTAGASSTTCGLSAYDYSTVAGISLKDGAAPPAVTVTTNPIPVRHARETSW